MPASRNEPVNSPLDKAIVADDPRSGQSDLTGRPIGRWEIFSVLWIFPSFGAIWILLHGPRLYWAEPDFLKAFRAVALEEWVALALLWIHAALVFLAWRSHGKQSRADRERDVGNLS